jgi:uncharacterized membrane protein
VYQRRPRWGWYLLIPSLGWLLFFPNAPYIVTDFLHLQYRPPIPLWYDMGLIATFAWTGLFLAVYSLRSMQELVKAMAGSVVSWLFVLGIASLSGLGIYVGRFLGWNSWDLLLRPRAVLADMVIHLTHPLEYPATFGVSFMFALFLFICYLTMTTDFLRQPS